jgi:hypothetical protein
LIKKKRNIFLKDKVNIKIIIFNYTNMDKYICTLCDKNLETRQRFWKHKNRKNPCVTDKIILKKIDYDLTIKVIEEKDKKIKENEKEIRFLKEKLELLNVIHEQRNQIENKYK